MPREIVIQQRDSDHPKRVEQRARQLLNDDTDGGDDEVLAAAVRIAFREKYDVLFRVGTKIIPPDRAYRILCVRYLDIRAMDPFGLASEPQPLP